MIAELELVEKLETALAAATDGSPQFDASLQALLVALQRQNDNEAFRVCLQCAHFRRRTAGAQCGLTGEPLAITQTEKICREWRRPEETLEPAST